MSLSSRQYPDRQGLYAFSPRRSSQGVDLYVLCPNGCGDYTVTPRELGEPGALPVHRCQRCEGEGQPNAWTPGELVTQARADARSAYFAGLKKGSHGGKTPREAFVAPSGGGFGEGVDAANAQRLEADLSDRGTVVGPKGCFARSAGVLDKKRKLRIHPDIAKKIRTLGEASGLSRNQLLNLALKSVGRTSVLGCAPAFINEGGVK